MTGKIFRSIMAAAACVMLACTLIIMGCLYDYFTGIQTRQLWDELSLAAAGVEASGRDYLSSLSDSNNRITWIAADGSVIYDAEVDEQTMESHADREEVQEALSSGKGYSQRYSDTLLEKTVYCAQRLSDGTVLRISVSTAGMTMLLFGMLQPICAVFVIVLLLALLLANRLSKRIVQPLNHLDLDHPLENKAYDEIAPLLRRINQQHMQINSQLQQLERRKNEFEQITASMNEGLVLLNGSGIVLSINAAAKKLFNAETQPVGQDFLTIERSRELNDAAALAMQCGKSEIYLERGGLTYRINIGRIDSNGEIIGLVLLSFDVTEKIHAERTRREFTANVSHELKTPLTAILGSSELLTADMVKPEDIPRFAGHIHDEAARLLTLIEDIIRLSQLDEGAAMPTETIDLGFAARDAADRLRAKAEQNKISLNIDTQSCQINTVPGLVHEIAYNLIENAIKYNTAGGSVNIVVSSGGILTVSDTGIGIPPEHLPRVFERFYRVDKSHSKHTGGTGLGLSIVKHACAYLNAEIDLKSEINKGTSVTVDFSSSVNP